MLMAEDAARLKKTLEERVSDVAGFLGRHTAQGRRMLREILTDKIELEAVGSRRKRGYAFGARRYRTTHWWRGAAN